MTAQAASLVHSFLVSLLSLPVVGRWASWVLPTPLLLLGGVGIVLSLVGKSCHLVIAHVPVGFLLGWDLAFWKGISYCCFTCAPFFSDGTFFVHSPALTDLLFDTSLRKLVKAPHASQQPQHLQRQGAASGRALPSPYSSSFAPAVYLWCLWTAGPWPTALESHYSENLLPSPHPFSPWFLFLSTHGFSLLCPPECHSRCPVLPAPLLQWPPPLALSQLRWTALAWELHCSCSWLAGMFDPGQDSRGMQIDTNFSCAMVDKDPLSQPAFYHCFCTSIPAPPCAT